jgi:2-succinyl-5-enolpyruvyl-6-hydroxy-3-cyclohexene-1-carboxylate synthase
MILLTADRPPELRDTGANQAIDQVKLFGDAVRWYFELPCPVKGVHRRFAGSSINHAVYRAREQRGPVHINCCFREPFLPKSNPKPPKPRIPGTVYMSGSGLATGACEELDFALQNAASPCLIIGELRSEAEREAVLALQAHTGWLALPDISSGLRLGTHAPGFCHYYDLLLSNAEFANAFRPDLVLQIGGRLISKRLAEHLALRRPQQHILLSAHPGRQDPEHRVSMRIVADIASSCQNLLAKLPVGTPVGIAQASSNIDSILDDVIFADGLSEASVARELPRLLRPGQALVLGASMPIRALDSLGAIGGPRVAVAANRGASGIDGTVATACGYAHAAAQPVVLLLGDLALLHDLNSLDLVRRCSQPVSIIVINNDGGGIFSFLPIARREDVFEPWFATPHGRDFAEIAKTFSLSYAQPTDRAAFAQAVQAGTQLIEIRCPREQNVQLHSALRERVATSQQGSSMKARR